LCQRFGVEGAIPEEIFPALADKKAIEALNERREKLLRELCLGRGVTAWDVFDGSGIGEERNAVARRFVKTGSPTLDVASGRGYFAFACARLGAAVTATDVMDGEDRAGWWKAFLESAATLGLGRSVEALQADALRLPLRSQRFETVTSIHALRNILARGRWSGVVSEMQRVTAMGGSVVIAESCLEPESEAEEVYLAYLRLREALGWETRLPQRGEVEEMLEEEGLSKIRTSKERFARDYAPVEFPAYSISGQAPSIREKHLNIERRRAKVGIKPTPVMIVSATKV